MSPPSPSSDPASSSIEHLERRLLSITEAFACPICHATLRAPVLLPCGHILCSECARRHLSIASTCPQPFCKSPATATSLTPLRALDTSLESIRSGTARAAPANVHRENGSRLVFLSRKDARAKARFVARLKANHLPTSGSLDALAARDREFVIKWNANIDAAAQRSRKEIADEVFAQERHRERERRKAAHASSSAFFAAKQEIADDPDVPVEGDDFAALISKTRARKERMKREREKGSQNDDDVMHATKMPKLGRSQAPSLPPEQDATIRDPTIPKTTAPVVYDVDADILVIPPSPPSVPPSPPEIPPAREVDGDSIRAVADGSQAPTNEPSNTVANAEGRNFDNAASDGEPVPKDTKALADAVEAISPLRTESTRFAPDNVRPVTTQTPSPARMSTTASTQPKDDLPGSAEHAGRSSTKTTPPLSEEQLRRMERNRQIAIEKKKMYLERLRRERMRQPDF